MNRLIRVVVADDEPVVRIGVKNMLTPADGFEIVGEAGDGNGAITQTADSRPDVLLLDVKMPRVDGLETLRTIQRNLPAVKVLLLTSTITAQQTIEALHIGARGIVLKDASLSDLQTAVKVVWEGDYWVTGKRLTSLHSALQELTQNEASRQRKAFGLTFRELEVVGLIVEGLGTRDIAKRLGVTEETIKRHVTNIFDKTGTSTRLELALFAIAHKVVGLQAIVPESDL